MTNHYRMVVNITIRLSVITHVLTIKSDYKLSEDGSNIIVEWAIVGLYGMKIDEFGGLKNIWNEES